MGHPQSPPKPPIVPLFEIELDLGPKGSREASRTLYRQLQAAILDGRLPAGAKLPPTRKSAAFLGVSRNTAAEVYERLVNERHAVTRHGADTYVAQKTAFVAPEKREIEPVSDHRLNEFWLRPDVAAAISFWRDRPDAALPRKGASVDFRPAMVDSRLFPLDVFRRVSAE